MFKDLAVAKSASRLYLPPSKWVKASFLTSVVLGVCITIFVPYGFITEYCELDVERYSSQQSIIDHLNLDQLSERKASETIFKFVSDIPAGVSRYSVFENPVSELIEYLLQPIYDSEFLNTILEPSLLESRGSALCHQHALSMVLLAESRGIAGRVVWLEGHVVAELFFEGKWNFFDANKNFSVQDKQGRYLSVSEFIASLDDHNLRENWEMTTERYAKDYGGLFLSTDNNRTYRYYPFELYVEIYYMVTRSVSYSLYLFLFGYAIWLMAHLVGGPRQLPSKQKET